MIKRIQKERATSIEGSAATGNRGTAKQNTVHESPAGKDWPKRT
jgi:hypothetical protein